MNVIPTTICLIGSYGVGKSSLVSSYIYNKFNNIESTIGMSFFTKLIKHDNYCIDLSIWDTAGQERYSSLLSMYTRNANIILSMLDPTNPTDSYNYVKKNIVNVTADVTIDLSEDRKAELKKLLDQSLKKNTEISFKVNPDLIGGIRLRVGNELVDASIGNHLRNMRQKMLDA